MNGPGKSDKPVVPERPANADASTSFWELFAHVQRVEGRGLAKENGEGVPGELPPAGPAKQVDRTQSRVGEGTADPEDLLSALDRVRQDWPSSSKARARCGSSARRDLCGGRRATAVPTATPID